MPAAQTAFDFGPTPTRALSHALSSARKAIANVWQSQVGLRAVSATPAPKAVVSEARDPKSALEQLLRSALDMPVRLVLTDNRRTMISLRKGPASTEARLHHMFLEADEPTRAALFAYLRNGDRAASTKIGQFIDGQRDRIRMRKRRAPQIHASSVHHDLLQIYAEVNAKHFDNKVDARISWGRDTQVKAGRRRRSIKLGSYCSRERLIRVHPGLDAEHIPRFFVEYIVYHEMLHHVMPPVVRGGRRELHGREFKRRERMFPLYDEALRWERNNLDRLLRA
jgi:predicted metal-dependent hydrolase